jgi:predicted Zn-dependent protease
MPGSSTFKLCLATALFLTVAGCKSAEERAEEYYKSGIALMEAGDPDRAMVEFRNVFELDAGHRDARAALARMMLDANNLQGAYSQYLRLVEQYPDDMEGRRALAEIAFEVRNWDEFERHGEAAERLAPDDPRVQAIAIGRKYRVAVIDDDNPARDALVAPAEALLEQLPGNVILSNLLIDSATRDNSYGTALTRIDGMIANKPADRALYIRRIMLLSQMGDEGAVEENLRAMVERFPDDLEVKGMLVRYYVGKRDMDKAEAFLREIADPAAEDPGLFVDLIRFVSEVRGPDAARVEIERAIAVNPDPDRFKAMLALLDFQSGEQDKAIADLEAIVAAAAEPTDETRGIKVMLAKMLATTGNAVGARRLIEEVLAENDSQVDALKMQASWQVQSDDTDGAISNLRLVLDNAPEDVQAMNLMAEAYTRAGSHDLARDFLALAVDASNNAPDPSIRYAKVLMQDQRYLPAEDVLLPALRLAPDNIDILLTLGQLYLAMEDVPRATQVIDTMRRLGTDQATAAANGLEAGVLNQSGGSEQAMAFLEQLATGDNADLNSRLALLRAKIAVGETEEALNLAKTIASENPGNDQIAFALSATRAAVGDLDGAEEGYRALVEVNKERPTVWLELSRVLMRKGDREAADAAIDEGLAAAPDNGNLLWAKATMLERDGDVDGAIDIYQGLYEQSSGALVVANNLASLLATYKTDPESLERAWTIARRLKDADNPALQDTYGWIAFRRGEVEEALPYLESAAKGLPRDPLVQMHLGMVYVALERNADALAQLQAAVEVAGPADTRPQIEEAKAEIARLRTLVEN